MSAVPARGLEGRGSRPLSVRREGPALGGQPRRGERQDTVVTALESVGGSLESFYYAVGETDVLGVFDIPDQASAVSLSLMINSTGAVDLHLTPLMTPKELDAAASRAPSYRAPGQ